MEPIASPTWSDLLQTIKEKKYRVSADYLLREIAGEYAIIPVGGCVSDFECCNGSKRYRRIPLEYISAAAYHFGGRCTGGRRV